MPGAEPAPISVRTVGEGPRVVLVHGGIGPELSWERQLPLAERWTLAIPSRRGYEPSPPADRQDWAADADDLDALLGEPAHLVGFSYGGVAAALVAGRRPAAVRSLTLIEPPLFSIAPDDPAIRRMAELSARFLANDAAEDPEAHWRFLAVAGVDRPLDPARAREVERATRLARRMRPPHEAVPDLAAIAAAGVPVLCASGGHEPGLDRVCDLIAERTGGERLRLPGSGHAVQRAAGFNDRLEAFLTRGGGGAI